MFAAKLATTAVAAAALALAGLAGAATASANGVDDEFLSNIAAADITWGSERAVIKQAHLVCQFFDEGATAVDVAEEILAGTDLNTEQTAVFMVEAVSAYCPEHLDQF